MQRIQGATAGLGGVHPCKVCSCVEGIKRRRIDHNQFSRGNVLLHQGERACDLFESSLLAEAFQLQHRREFERVQWGVNNLLPGYAVYDQSAVRLRVIQFNQTTGIEVDNGFSPCSR